MNTRNNLTNEDLNYIEPNEEERLKLEENLDGLQKRICEFEVYMMQMEAAFVRLQKERDKIDKENVELQKENEKFHQEIKFEKIHNADLMNELRKSRRNHVAVEKRGLCDCILYRKNISVS